VRPADEDFGSASKPEGNVTGCTDVFAGERVRVKLCCGREHRPRHDTIAAMAMSARLAAQHWRSRRNLHRTH
jgi:hypothetical protein